MTEDSSRWKATGYGPSVGADEIWRQRRIWESKPQVRSFYEIQVFPRVLAALPSQTRVVEIGSGSGTLRSWLPRGLAADVVDAPWLDLRCAAERLPFVDGSLSGLVAINVLHHLSSIGRLLEEAERALVVGGRLVCVEPWMTPLSRVFYRWVHQEPCHPVSDPLFGDHGSRGPMDGNTYLPYQAVSCLPASLRTLRLAHVELFSGLGWCLSMGFREGSLLPDRVLRGLLKLEDRTGPLWRRWAALNALLVFERTAR